MATLPTDADTTPNYTAAQHATHHNTIHGLWNLLTTKGDLFVATAAQAFARLGVGTNGQVLTADSGESAGVKWATPSGSSLVTAVAEGTDGATRSSATLGPWSTAWTASIAVTSGQVVDIIVCMSLMCSSDESIFMAIRRGSTTIYENPHYTSSPNARSNILTHFWRDTSPGTGTITYEVYVASNSGATLTLKNGATLDTTKELTQGKSMMRLMALAP